MLARDRLGGGAGGGGSVRAKPADGKAKVPVAEGKAKGDMGFSGGAGDDAYGEYFPDAIDRCATPHTPPHTQMGQMVCKN